MSLTGAGSFVHPAIFDAGQAPSMARDQLYRLDQPAALQAQTAGLGRGECRPAGAAEKKRIHYFGLESLGTGTT